MERIKRSTRTHGKRYGSASFRDDRLILSPRLYATRAKYHGYRDGVVDAVRAHLNPLDIRDFDMTFLYLRVKQ